MSRLRVVTLALVASVALYAVVSAVWAVYSKADEKARMCSPEALESRISTYVIRHQSLPASLAHACGGRQPLYYLEDTYVYRRVTIDGRRHGLVVAPIGTGMGKPEARFTSEELTEMVGLGKRVFQYKGRHVILVPEPARPAAPDKV